VDVLIPAADRKIKLRKRTLLAGAGESNGRRRATGKTNVARRTRIDAKAVHDFPDILATPAGVTVSYFEWCKTGRLFLSGKSEVKRAGCST